MVGIFDDQQSLVARLDDASAFLRRYNFRWLNDDWRLETLRSQCVDALGRIEPLKIDQDVLDHPKALVQSALLELRAKADKLAQVLVELPRTGLHQHECEGVGECQASALQTADVASLLIEALSNAVNTFYHYCSVPVFHSIITNRTIRLFDPLAMNDAMEGVWARKLFFVLCREAGLDDAEIALLELRFDSVPAPRRAVMCFSEDGDLLSQWRGYADDGRGFAIGFARDIATLPPDEPPASFVRVWYDDYTQRRALKSGVEQAADALRRKNDNDLKNVIGDFQLAAEYRIKNPQFKEELEWRLIVQISEQYSGYHARQNRLVPFCEYLLGPKHAQHVPTLINEIVLGPKNETPIEVVRAMLPPELNRDRKVAIRRSAATYR